MSVGPSGQSDKDAVFAVNEAESALLRMAPSGNEPRTIFIFGAPRTGSTYAYQILVRTFRLPFIANITNDCFPQTPIVGLAIQRGVSEEIAYTSRFGKTEGAFQPSEGSGPMTHWFGGGHPSQDVSCHILEGREGHFRTTLSACEYINEGTPLLIKNAWNCFRVSYLSTALPRAQFIWLQRDIREAAASDLEARYLTKRSALAWNSATPSNLECLLLRPPTEQVVENQLEFNRAIGDALAENAQGRWLHIWFEDLIGKPDVALEKIAAFLDRPIEASLPLARPVRSRRRRLQTGESKAIKAFVKANSLRFQRYCYPTEIY